MEEVVGCRAPQPAMPNFSRFPPVALTLKRRSHLDSATHRTLTRIFSHCLQSLNPIPPASPSAPIDLTADQNGSKNTPEAQDMCERLKLDSDSNGNSAPEDDLRHGVGFLEGLVSEKPHQGDERKDHDQVSAKDGILNALEEELGRDECDSGDLPEELISSFAGLINLVDGNVAVETQAGHMEVDSVESKRVAVEETESVDPAIRVTHTAVEVSGEMLRSSEETQHGKAEEEQDDYIISELATEETTKRITTVEEGMDQQADICADSVLNISGMKNLSGDHQVSSMGVLLDDEETEEGQIPDDFQILEQCSDSDGGISDLEDRNLDERLVYGSSDTRANLGHTLFTTSNQKCTSGQLSPREDSQKEARLNIPNYDYRDRFREASENERVSKPEDKKSSSDLLEADHRYKANVPPTSALLEYVLCGSPIQNKVEPDDAKDIEVQKKKRHGPLTEARKAKKKKAKKRKRAEKEREQGIKRLKLQPIVKPKTVKYCNYYLKGRCQQGDQCKFSHDIVPLTKSQPCRYLATDTCLKGEDCPFDHELSKYPCHNFMSKGMCIRGDKCKFSHKMSEGSPTVPIIGKSDTPLSSDKPNLRKELNIKKTSPVYGSYTITTSRAKLSKPMHAEGNLTENCLRPSVQAPNGIRFLSFGKGSLDNTIKHQDRRPDDNHSGIKLVNQSFSFSAQKSPVGQCKRRIVSSDVDCHPATNTLTSAESRNNSSSNGLAPSTSRSLQNELSDAAKILDEFLFGKDS